MANTWTDYCTGVSFSGNSVMHGLLNEGSRILRILRVGLLNTQTSTVTGVIARIFLNIYRATTTWGSETSNAPVAHDTANSALDTVSAGYGGTLATSGSEFEVSKIVWSTDEPAVNTAGSYVAAAGDEWECFIPMNIMWAVGYGDTTRQLLTLRSGEAVALINENTAGAGLLDSWIEFLDEAS